MEATSLGDMLRRTAARVPDKVAMMAPEKSGFREIRYRELLATAEAYAGAIQSLGLERGDRLAIFSENCVEWAFTDWGCQLLGVIVVPIYPTLPGEQAGYIIQDCGAKVVVAGGPEQMAKLEFLEGVKLINLKGDDGLEGMARAAQKVANLDEEVAKTKLDDCATIIYTSGTTGQPKGAMLPHR